MLRSLFRRRGTGSEGHSDGNREPPSGILRMDPRRPNQPPPPRQLPHSAPSPPRQLLSVAAGAASASAVQPERDDEQERIERQVRAWALPVLARILREAGCQGESADRLLEEEACGALGAWAFSAFHLGRPPRTVTFDSPRSVPSLFAEHMRLAAFAEQHRQRQGSPPASRLRGSLRSPLGSYHSRASGIVIRRRSPSDRQLLREYDSRAAQTLQTLRDAEAPALAGFPTHRLREVEEIRDELFRDYKWAVPGREATPDPPAALGSGSASTPAATPLPNFRAVLSLCPNLRRLHLDGFVDVSALAVALCPLPLLESLVLRSASCTGDTMALLLAKLRAHTPRLARLSFRPSGCLWEPNCFDDPVRAAPSLLPALREIEVGAVRDAAHVLSGWAADRAFCGRAERVVVTSQPPSLARLRPPLPDPFVPALELLRAAPRLLHLGVGMDSVCTVFSRQGALPTFLAAAGEHPSLRTLMARTDCFHASPEAAPLRARRLRSIAALLDARAWAEVEAELLAGGVVDEGRAERVPKAGGVADGAGGCRGGPEGRAASASAAKPAAFGSGYAYASAAQPAGTPSGRRPRPRSPIQRVPWHFCSIRDRVAAFVGAAERGTQPHIFQFQIDMNLWEESEGESEGEGEGAEHVFDI